ncbi:alanine dehydrogenase [Anaerosolibacter carboniphilus]|uniref:alanine dehydrogenase n=1 Tax=Anaerosolibacter carboniphilus TaxID=1417629 RepID=A0A841KZU5_9FIRM|nr:alanine dehydrogenase [Anaerosolibacter carboniphilus]MBB6215655.1 alanine dehydrogenase [Anaerosolibacter carboniphilus]
MKIGIPKEMANSEYRVGMTHLGVRKLVEAGHEAFVCSGAGIYSGINDQQYRDAGAVILESSAEVYVNSDLIVKVKPPINEEFEWIRKEQIIFSYILPERNRDLCHHFIQKEITAFGYEAVEDQRGDKPLLAPMSEIAGRMAIMVASNFLQTTFGGKGLMVGCMSGIAPVEVVILGAGIAAQGAAFVAAGLGCNVTVLNRGINRLKVLEQRLGRRAVYLTLSNENLTKFIGIADILINTIDQMGEKDAHLISREMLRDMKKGSVIVDVACDKQGTIETSKPTTHEVPVYVIDDIIHCAIPNLPGAVPQTATLALAEATLPYILKLANQGYKKSVLNDMGLRKGLCFYEGRLLHMRASENFGLDYNTFESCSLQRKE